MEHNSTRGVQGSRPVATSSLLFGFLTPVAAVLQPSLRWRLTFFRNVHVSPEITPIRQTLDRPILGRDPPGIFDALAQIARAGGLLRGGRLFLTRCSPAVQYLARAPWKGSHTAPYRCRGETIVDAIFIFAVVALYAVTYWIVRALSRLGGVE
jgi:hypothetical protein